MSQYVTKNDLREEFASFGRELYAYLGKMEERIERRLELKLEQKLEQKLEEKLDAKFKESLSDFANIVTDLMAQMDERHKAQEMQTTLITGYLDSWSSYR